MARSRLDQALPIARQIAEALEAAHDAGIIHRDLKPANIKVRPDGTVKVLDFGLAKALDPVASAPVVGVQNSPTVTSPMMTGRGIILGTAAYMAPEQARGRAVDKRADIWAFGVVLYEMLTGERAFKGDDRSDVLAAVLRQDLDWTRLPTSTPPPIRRLLERCLERDPRRRLRDIGDARIEIDEALKSPRSERVPTTGPAHGRGAMTAAVIATALVAALLGAMAARRLAMPPHPPVIRFSIPAPPGKVFRGLGRALDISRDGTQVVYATIDGVFLRSMSTLETRQISEGFQTGIAPDLLTRRFDRGNVVAQGAGDQGLLVEQNRHRDARLSLTRRWRSVRRHELGPRRDRRRARQAGHRPVPHRWQPAEASRTCRGGRGRCRA